MAGDVPLLVAAVGSVEQRARPHCNVRLDLFPGSVDVLREAGHLEDGLLVPRGGHDVGVGLLLDALDGGALGPDHQSDHLVRHSHLDCRLARDVSDHLPERVR